MCPHTLPVMAGLRVNWWVHTSIVSRPQVLLSPTSEFVIGFTFRSTSLLFGRSYAFPSKKPKCTIKSISDHNNKLTYLLSKHITETHLNQTPSLHNLIDNPITSKAY